MNLKKLLSTFLWVLILVISVPCLAYEGLTVKIGYAQGLELYHQSSILKETLEYLQKKIPNYRFELLPISSVDTQEDIKKEKIDFLIAPSNFFVELSGGIPFTHLATRIFDGTKDPAKTVGSTFVVRAELKIAQPPFPIPWGAGLPLSGKLRSTDSIRTTSLKQKTLHSSRYLMY